MGSPWRPRRRPASRTTTCRRSAAPTSWRSGASTATPSSGWDDVEMHDTARGMRAACTWAPTPTGPPAPWTPWSTRSTPASPRPSTATPGTRCSWWSAAGAGPRSTASASSGARATRSTSRHGPGTGTATRAPRPGATSASPASRCSRRWAWRSRRTAARRRSTSSPATALLAGDRRERPLRPPGPPPGQGPGRPPLRPPAHQLGRPRAAADAPRHPHDVPARPGHRLPGLGHHDGDVRDRPRPRPVDAPAPR